jgi:hypothetical protein
VDFLTVTIYTDVVGNVVVVPLIKNQSFAIGLSPFPEVSRIPVYLGCVVHPQLVLRRLLFPHIISINRISFGNLGPAAKCMSCLVAEVALRGWPVHLLCDVLKSIPIKHETFFIECLRRFAKTIKKAIPDEHPERLTYDVCKLYFNNYVSALRIYKPDVLANDPILGSKS